MRIIITLPEQGDSSSVDIPLHTVLMIVSGIILIPWQVSRIVKEWVRMGSKKEVICPGCGLRYHDVDASHCKSCGHIIYREYDGD